MPWKLTNIALDPKTVFQRRRAARMEMEPVIGSLRIRLRCSHEISDAAYAAAEKKIKHYESQGVLKAENLSGTPAPPPKVEKKPAPKKPAAKPAEKPVEKKAVEAKKVAPPPKKKQKAAPPPPKKKKKTAEVPIAPLPPPPKVDPPVAVQTAEPTPTKPAKGEG